VVDAISLSRGTLRKISKPVLASFTTCRIPLADHRLLMPGPYSGAAMCNQLGVGVSNSLLFDSA